MFALAAVRWAVIPDQAQHKPLRNILGLFGGLITSALAQGASFRSRSPVAQPVANRFLLRYYYYYQMSRRLSGVREYIAVKRNLAI